MITYELNHSWQMRELTEKNWLPAVVPGSVYQDYLNNGKMEDPYFRDNETKALALMEHDFVYRAVFDVEEPLLACPHVFLRFDGLDTLAEISLNGVCLGRADNMHRIWEYAVKDFLKPEGNELQVILRSPVNYVRKMDAENPDIAMSVDAMRGASYLRKAHGMFGWDWGPRLPDAGIWKQVFLIGAQEARIDNIYLEQKHNVSPGQPHGENGAEVELKILAEVERFGEDRLYKISGSAKDRSLLAKEQYSLHVTVYDPEGQICAKTATQDLSETEPALTVTIRRPQLWWPNGYGKQPLYTVTAELRRGDEMIDTWKRRIGLRTVRLIREKDAWGEVFCHEVNGVRIFAMGADYIPADNILPKATPERVRELLQSMADANENCVRVWGGGCYADDDFLDCCDELGLLVWQDFLFACATYDLTEEFEANIRAEFRDNILRLRNHACLGLWSGNNEMELFIAGDRAGWCLKPSQFADYFNMYEYIIPKMVKELDPQTDYIPSSPTSGGSLDDPGDENRGDVHYWDVWHGGKTVTEFRKFYFRYLSEFGFNSMPDMKTVESYTLPADRNLFSYVMEKHQRCREGNGTIMRYIEQNFLCPSSLELQVYASQLLQAEAMRISVEHFRANRGRCMGTVIWQLNDIWPCTSWAMIDYYGRWKAVQYMAKRFFAPLALFCEEESMLSQDPNINAEPYEVKNAVHFAICNETMEKADVSIQWEVRNADGSVSDQHALYFYDRTAEPLSAQWLEEEHVIEDLDIFNQYVSYRMIRSGETDPVSGGSVLFCAPKYFRFVDPKLRIEVVNDREIQVHAEAFAKSVEIYGRDQDIRLEDNFFDMDPGTRTIRLLSGKAKDLCVRSVYDIR